MKLKKKKRVKSNIEVLIELVIAMVNPKINVPQTIAIFSIKPKKLKYVALSSVPWGRSFEKVDLDNDCIEPNTKPINPLII